MLYINVGSKKASVSISILHTGSVAYWRVLGSTSGGKRAGQSLRTSSLAQWQSTGSRPATNLQWITNIC